jgi:hypothetical protein
MDKGVVALNRVDPQPEVAGKTLANISFEKKSRCRSTSAMHKQGRT